MSDTPSADRPGADQPGPTPPTTPTLSTAPTAPTTPTPPLAPPEQRGGLDVADKALRSIAASAAAVPGTAPSGSLPSAKVTSAGGRVAVAVEVALVWPRPAAEVAAAVRDAVRAALTTLGGVQVDAVHVTVAKVVAGTDARQPTGQEPPRPGHATQHDRTEHDQAEQHEESTP